MKVGIVVILFHPTAEDLCQVEQLRNIYDTEVVDNTILNRGLAAAQNIGIRALQDRGADYIILLDQDSRITADYPRHITEEFERIRQTHPHLAALGPKIYFHEGLKDADGYIEQNEIIASGTCIRADILDKIGLMDEDLFIDFVDFDWCWRAKSMGYECGITANVRMEHRVGDKDKKILGHYVFFSAPMRYYYQYRNHCRLCRKDYVPSSWKRRNGIKHLLRFFWVPWVHGGMETKKYMWKGWMEA